MKKILTGFVLLASLLTGTSVRGETRPDFGLKPIDDAFLEKINEMNFAVISQEREFLITSFLTENTKKFKQGDLMKIRTAFNDMSENSLMAVTTADYKDPTTVLLVSIFLGGLGVDRFMLGQPVLGILKLITVGGLGVWWLVDLFTISNATRTVNYKEFSKAAQNMKLFLPETKG